MNVHEVATLGQFLNAYGNGLHPSNVVVATIVMDCSNLDYMVFSCHRVWKFLLWLDVFDIKQSTCHC
jgi:hypothetical protein